MVNEDTEPYCRRCNKLLTMPSLWSIIFGYISFSCLRDGSWVGLVIAQPGSVLKIVIERGVSRRLSGKNAWAASKCLDGVQVGEVQNGSSKAAIFQSFLASRTQGRRFTYMHQADGKRGRRRRKKRTIKIADAHFRQMWMRMGYWKEPPCTGILYIYSTLCCC